MLGLLKMFSVLGVASDKNGGPILGRSNTFHDTEV